MRPPKDTCSDLRVVIVFVSLRSSGEWALHRSPCHPCAFAGGVHGRPLLLIMGSLGDGYKLRLLSFSPVVASHVPDWCLWTDNVGLQMPRHASDSRESTQGPGKGAGVIVRYRRTPCSLPAPGVVEPMLGNSQGGLQLRLYLWGIMSFDEFLDAVLGMRDAVLAIFIFIFN